MNNQKLQKHIEEKKSEYNQMSLSGEEKLILKNKLFERIPEPSPFFNWSLYMRATSISFAAFLLVTSPVVVAAEKSLPGDFLYNFKTNVNEEVVGVFIPHEEKAEYKKKLLTKRAFEIKRISEEGDIRMDQLEDVEDAMEDSVIDVLAVVANETKTEEEIIKDHKDLIAVLEFSENIIEEKKENKNDDKNFSKIKDFKLLAETSLLAHVESISESDEEENDSVEILVKKAKENIDEIPENEKEEFILEVEKIEDDSESQEVGGYINLTINAKEAEPEVSVEVKTETKLEMVLDLYEQIADKKLELEIEKLEL